MVRSLRGRSCGGQAGDEGDGVGGYTLTPAGEPESFGSGGFDRYTIGIQSHDFGHGATHILDVRCKPGCLSSYGYISVDGFPAFLVKQSADVSEQQS